MYQTEIVECVFVANSANKCGGAIHSTQSNVYIRSCFLSDNSGRNGSGVYGLGTKQIMQISYTVIKHNEAGSFGGGVWLYGGNLIMEGSSVSANTAKMDGGGLYMGNVITHITHSIIDSYQAEHQGGGCWQRGWHGYDVAAAFKLTWCYVTSNTVKMGAGLYLMDSNTNILHSSKENNVAMRQGCVGHKV